MHRDTVASSPKRPEMSTAGSPHGLAGPSELDGASIPVLLVVDDDQHIRDLMELALSMAGFEVFTAADGAAALAAARRHAPDLILLDVMMPGMSGIDVVHEIRRDLTLAATPVVLLSAHAEDEVVGAALLAGADGYITKPFDVDLVAERLHVVLQARRMTTGQVPPPVTRGIFQPPVEPLKRDQEVLLTAAERGEATWVVGRVVRGHSADLLVEVAVTCAGLLKGSALTVAMATSQRHLFLRHDAQVVALGDRVMVSLRHGPSSPSAHSRVRCPTGVRCSVTQRDPHSGQFTSFTGSTVDMSPIGACVRIHAPLTVDEQCSLVLELFGQAVHVCGIVKETSERFARITFPDLNRGQAQLINAHVYEELRRRARRDAVEKCSH
jgi:CheY-like chemotaxis protein